MAADSAQKRLSAMNIGCPWRGCNTVPSGTVDDEERASVIYLYSGIPGGGGGGSSAVANRTMLTSVGKMMR